MDQTMMDEPQPDTSITSTGTTTRNSKPKHLELASCTIRSPTHAYAHLLVSSSSSLKTGTNIGLEIDALQARSYCAAALRQYLGLMGSAVPVDVLRVSGSECWVRVPHDDLPALSAAVTAWQGTTADDGGADRRILRVIGCSDWLGALVGRQGEEDLWKV